MHAPVGEHDFEPEHEIARHAIGQRAGAAGIGREIAADGAASFRAERQRKQAVDVGGGLLRLDEHDAGLAGHGVRRGVDLADLVHARERQHDLAVVRRLAADKAGIAALRHDRGIRLVGELQDGRDFRRRARPQHDLRVAAIEPALLGEVGFLIRRVR